MQAEIAIIQYISAGQDETTLHSSVTLHVFKLMKLIFFFYLQLETKLRKSEEALETQEQKVKELKVNNSNL